MYGYIYLTYNKISAAGLDVFDKEQYAIGDSIANPDGAIVRSAALHDVQFPETLKAIARAGAGTNNIPIDRCSAEGIVVFNAHLEVSAFDFHHAEGGRFVVCRRALARHFAAVLHGAAISHARSQHCEAEGRSGEAEGTGEVTSQWGYVADVHISVFFFSGKEMEKG